MLKVKLGPAGLVHLADEETHFVPCFHKAILRTVELMPPDTEVTCEDCLHISSGGLNHINNINNINNINDLADKPVVHAFMDTDTGEIFISAFETDDAMWENNHIVLKDARGSKHASVLNILSNVLAQCHVVLKNDA